MLHTMLQNMFHLQLPILEKILRPIIVYIVLIGFLRIFGKRELAQLNPFDLVVLLSLSNTVQNAMIGDDNSLSGGLIGAFSLLAANWLLNRALFAAPKLTEALQGNSTVLIRDGVVDEAALRKEILSGAELIDVLHKQGIHSPSEIKLACLEPSGNFYIEKKEESLPAARYDEMATRLDELMHEIQGLRRQLSERN